MDSPDTSARESRTASQSLVGTLPDGPLDIIGDVHGEWQALAQLLSHLGYDSAGRHPQGRRLVFVGDLCDRGLDSPAVMDWFCNVWEAGRCDAVIGNHEINLIREDAKDGAGWYFATRTERDRSRYGAFVVASAAQRERYAALCNLLPVALQRPDLRVVHAAWLQPQIDAAAQMARGTLRSHYDSFEKCAADAARNGPVRDRLLKEKADWPHDLENQQLHPPMLAAHGERELLKQMTNPLKVLTTGVEALAPAPFYAGGKWRFTERQPWWDSYGDDVSVVIGHYWRQFSHSAEPAQPLSDKPDTNRKPGDDPGSSPGEQALFKGIPGNSWHGLRHNVFCVDFSVGARWSERLRGNHDPAQGRLYLAALRWPEKELVLDTGQHFPTIT